MKTDNVLDFLCKERTNSSLDSILVYNKSYQSAEIKVSSKLNYL